MTSSRLGYAAGGRSKANPDRASETMGGQVTLRPIVPADEPLLRAIYASTRADEMALLPWQDTEKEAFLAQQFEAQHSFYQQEFKAARFDVIERDGKAIGRLYVDRRAEEIRIIDIALLPEARGAGIGGAIMRELLDEARDVGKAVTIHVERNNPALGLYRRLGFTDVEDQGVYLLMRWSASNDAD